MPKGLIDLISTSTEDVPLIYKPEITLFKSKIHRHTPFGLDDKISKHYVNNGSSLEIPLSNNGDIITHMYLEINLPRINVDVYVDTRKDYEIIGERLVSDMYKPYGTKIKKDSEKTSQTIAELYDKYKRYIEVFINKLTTHWIDYVVNVVQNLDNEFSRLFEKIKTTLTGNADFITFKQHIDFYTYIDKIIKHLVFQHSSDISINFKNTISCNLSNNDTLNRIYDIISEFSDEQSLYHLNTVLEQYSLYSFIFSIYNKWFVDEHVIFDGQNLDTFVKSFEDIMDMYRITQVDSDGNTFTISYKVERSSASTRIPVSLFLTDKLLSRSKESTLEVIYQEYYESNDGILDSVKDTDNSTNTFINKITEISQHVDEYSDPYEAYERYINMKYTIMYSIYQKNYNDPDSEIANWQTKVNSILDQDLHYGRYWSTRQYIELELLCISCTPSSFYLLDNFLSIEEMSTLHNLLDNGLTNIEKIIRHQLFGWEEFNIYERTHIDGYNLFDKYGNKRFSFESTDNVLPKFRNRSVVRQSIFNILDRYNEQWNSDVISNTYDELCIDYDRTKSLEPVHIQFYKSATKKAFTYGNYRDMKQGGKIKWIRLAPKTTIYLYMKSNFLYFLKQFDNPSTDDIVIRTNVENIQDFEINSIRIREYIANVSFSNIYLDTCLNPDGPSFTKYIDNAETLIKEKLFRIRWLKGNDINGINSFCTESTDDNLPCFDKIPTQPVPWSWKPQIGFWMIKSIELILGDETIDSLSGESIYSHTRLMIDPSQRRGIDHMVGNIDKLKIKKRVHDSYRTSIPLPFGLLFSGGGKGLPIIALSHANARIRIKLRPFIECVTPVENTYPVIKQWSVNLSTVSAYLSMKERESFVRERHTVLYRRTNIRYQDNLTDYVIKLTTVKPTSDIWVMLLRKYPESMCQLVPSMPITHAGLKANGTILTDCPTSIKSGRPEVTWFTARSSLDYKSSDHNLLLFPFSIHPTDPTPSGSLNYSELNDPVLRVFPYTYPDYRAIIISRCWDLINIYGGQGGLMYSVN